MNNKVNKLIEYHFKSLYRSIHPYLLLSVCIGVMIFYIKSRFEEVNYETVLVMSDPYQIPVMVMIVIAGIFLSISAMLSITRERMSGVMEVFFYTPIRISDYLAGYLESHMFIYFIMAGLFIFSILITQAVTNIFCTYKSLLYFVVSIPVVACCIGMGIFFACISKNQRNALVYFFMMVLLFLGIQAGSSIVSSAVATQELLDLVFLRDILEKINASIAFLNPVACFISITEKFLAHDYRNAAVNVLWLILLSVFWFWASVKALRKRGVVAE